MNGESLLFRSALLTGFVFFTLVLLQLLGALYSLSFWFFLAPVYFFCITFVYSVFMDKKNLINSPVFFSMYPVLILVKLICTAALIVLYTEFATKPRLSFWLLVVVLYFLYSTLIAISLYKSR